MMRTGKRMGEASQISKGKGDQVSGSLGGPRGNQNGHSGHRKDRKGRLINILGILSACGIALGGLLLVQEGLARAKESLLQGSGIVENTIQLEAATAVEVEVQDIGQKLLTEEELLQVVRDMEGGGGVYPHEPGQGQLSMSQAITCGREWVETFFMPHVGMADYHMEENKADCFLWSLRGKEGEGEKDPLCSYWTLNFEVPELAEVGLTLNAVSGQVLIASIGLYGPVEYQDGEGLIGLLGDYAFSFETSGVASYSFAESGPEGPDRENGPIYHSISSQGLYAGLRTSSIVISRAGDSPGVTENVDICTIRLYLTTKVDDYPW